MSALYNSALRQSKAIRADLEAFSQSPTSNAALQGQLTTTINSFSRTLDDYQKSIDVELVPEKAVKGQDRIETFRVNLLEFRSRFAELKHERENSLHAANRSELLGRRPHTTSTPENPYSDSSVTSRGNQVGQNVNPLFSSSNPNHAPGSNRYSTYSSPYASSSNDPNGSNQREDHVYREQAFLSSTNQTLDEYLERGRAVLGDLGDQREMLKRTQAKLYTIGNTLGISGDTIRMVERRAKQDKWIFWAGVIIFIVFVYFVLRWLR